MPKVDTVESDGSHRRRRLVGNFARAIVSVAILAIIASQIDLHAVWLIASNAHLGWLVFAVVLAVSGRVYAAIRWYLLVRGRHPEAIFGRIVRLVFTSTLFGMFLPGTLGVEVIRVYGLSKSTADLALSFASVLVERLLAMTVLFILVLIGLLFAPQGLPDVLFDVAWLGLLAIVCGSVAILHPGIRRFGDRFISAPRLAPIKKRLHRVYDALDIYKTQPVTMAWSVAAAFGAVAFRIIPTVVLAYALGLEIALVHFAVFLPLIHFISQVPISLGGLGVRETAFVTLFGLVGVAAEAAFTLSLMIYIITVFSTLPGAWFYVRGGLADMDATPTTPAAPGTNAH